MEPPPEQAVPVPEPSLPPVDNSSVGTNGSAVAVESEVVKVQSSFVDPRWVAGTWDLKQFQKNGTTDWDAVIDAGNVIPLLRVLQSLFNYFFYY